MLKVILKNKLKKNIKKRGFVLKIYKYQLFYFYLKKCQKMLEWAETNVRKERN